MSMRASTDTARARDEAWRAGLKAQGTVAQATQRDVTSRPPPLPSFAPLTLTTDAQTWRGVA
eukprot:2109600-Pleurochrysis_carterae.AAC.1